MRSVFLWIVALLVTLVLAVYQEATGPTKPVRGTATVGGTDISYKLLRTHGGEGGLPIRLAVADPAVRGEVVWRRYPTQDPWQVLPLERRGEVLVAELPHQPPAGKVEYEVRLQKGTVSATFPERTAVARFKGAVNPVVLLVHILCMFLGMLGSARTALEAMSGRPGVRRLAWATFHLLFVGGLILGPIVQYQAFGAFWTGAPFGYDLTDNKTLIAVAGWGIALVQIHRRRNPRWWVLTAALLVLGVFVIPHSVLGSQIDWSKVPSKGQAHAGRPPGGARRGDAWPPSAALGRLKRAATTTPNPIGVKLSRMEHNREQ
jgi:hypothetical protein